MRRLQGGEKDHNSGAGGRAGPAGRQWCDSKVVLGRDYRITREAAYQYLRRARMLGTLSPAASNTLAQLTDV